MEVVKKANGQNTYTILFEKKVLKKYVPNDATSPCSAPNGRTMFKFDAAPANVNDTLIPP